MFLNMFTIIGAFIERVIFIERVSFFLFKF